MSQYEDSSVRFSKQLSAVPISSRQEIAKKEVHGGRRPQQ
jgi:hypothetical protein